MKLSIKPDVELGPVAMLRKIKEDLSREMQGMTFEQQKALMKEATDILEADRRKRLARRKPAKRESALAFA